MLRMWLTVIVALACTDRVSAQAQRSPTPSSVASPFKVTAIVEGLDHPWGLALLPDGTMLVTERPGRLRRISADGRISAALSGVPAVVARGQGGLLDVSLSPAFGEDRTIYLTYSEAGDGGAGTAVAKARLGANALEDVRVIWRQAPKVQSPAHWGSRIVFRPDGTLFITTGDRYNQRPRVQDLATTIGKVVRIDADGGIPPDNPFVGRGGAKPEVWSYGHRNIQAAALRSDGQLWTVEHGARGGDELNNPQPGLNYGWPVITYGVDYSGVRIGEGTARGGMEQPLYYWDPVIAPSGAAFYSGAAFPDWEGDLLIGSMTPGALVRLEIENGKVVRETRYLGELRKRIRDVQVDPAGRIYLITDEPKKAAVLRLEPKATLRIGQGSAGEEMATRARLN